VRCPVHGCALEIEDGDDLGAVFLCPVRDCDERRVVGRSYTDEFGQGIGRAHYERPAPRPVAEREPMGRQ